jgi:hypothetical protein
MPMLKIGAVRWQGRCSKHPRYNPRIDGLGGIKGGCRRCELLLEIHTCHGRLVRLLREFGARPEMQGKRDEEQDRQMRLLEL